MGLAEKLKASRVHGNQKGVGSLASGLSLAPTGSLWLLGSQALLLQGCLGDCAAAAWISQWTVFWMGRNSGHSLGSGWPGRGCQVYFLGILEGMSSGAKACHSSKIV